MNRYYLLPPDRWFSRGQSRWTDMARDVTTSIESATEAGLMVRQPTSERGMVHPASEVGRKRGTDVER
jgi:hypothetical protein